MCLLLILYFPVKVPVTEIMLEPLVVLLKSRDSQIQKAASLAISNFALNGAGEYTPSLQLSPEWHLQ